MRFNPRHHSPDNFSVVFDPETAVLQIRELTSGCRLQLAWPNGSSQAPTLVVRNSLGHTETIVANPSDITSIEIVLSEETGARSWLKKYNNYVSVDHRLLIPVTLVTPDGSLLPVIAQGGGGADNLSGGDTSDRLWGRFGDDILNGGDGHDRLFGGRGSDTLNGGNGHDRLYGGIDADSLNGEAGHDRLYGWHGNDTLDGGDGYDRLYGGSGNDSLNGGQNNDYIHGGSGFDTAVFSGSVSDYSIVQIAKYHWKVIGLDGSDRLVRVEALAFDGYTFFTDGRNNTPFAQAHAATTNEDTELRLETLLDGAFDPDNDEISLSAVTASGAGSTVSIAHDGAVIYNPDGAFEYLADGETVTDFFTYTISDGRGGTRTETVTVTITGVNDGPQVVSTAADAMGSVTEAGVTVSGTSGATGTLSATGAETGFTAVWSGSATGMYGTFSIGTDGVWNYELDDTRAATNALAHGATTSEVFRTTVTDFLGETAVQDVTVSITGSNDAPQLTSTVDALAGAVTAAGTGISGTPQAIGQLTAQDPDAGHVLTWSATGPATYGTFSVSGDGLWTYTLDNGLAATQALGANASLTQTFDVTVCDEHGALDVQQVDVLIHGSNDAPTVASALNASADAASAVQVIDLLAGANDVDTGETASLQLTNVSGLVPGLMLNGNALTLDPEHPDFMALPLGDERDITVTFDVVDAQGALVSQELTVTVTGVYTNTAPTTINDVYTLTENEIGTYAAELGVLANDTDVDVSDTLRLTSLNGVSISGETPVTLTSGTVVTINETGAMTIDSSAAFDALGGDDQGQEIVTYTVSDGSATTAGQMTLLVNGVNDAPVALDDTFNINNGVAQFSGNIYNNNGFGADYDPEGGYAYIVGANGSGFPGFASFTLASGAEVSLWSTGYFEYTPTNNAATSTGEFYTDSFTYAIEDEFFAESTATVRFNVEDVLPNAQVTIALEETVTGASGDNGIFWGTGSNTIYNGDGGNGRDGGDGGDGGVGTATIDGQDLLGDNNTDTLTITATAFGGRGGFGAGGGRGGDGVAGTYTSSSGLNYVEFFSVGADGIPLYARAQETISQDAGSGGDGADGGNGGYGGTGSAHVTNNSISAGAGADIVSFSAISEGGRGSSGGRPGVGGAGFREYGGTTSESRDIYYSEYDAIIQTHVTIRTSYGYAFDGEDGVDSSLEGFSGSAEAFVTGNVGAGGAGNDHLTLLAEVAAPYEDITRPNDIYRSLETSISNNTLSGDDGNDTLEIVATVDDSSARSDFDTSLTIFDNTLNGGADDDRFILNIDYGYSGYLRLSVASNTIAGGEGHDILDLSGSDDGRFHIDLSTQRWGAKEYYTSSTSNTITGVEEVRGARSTDVLIGSDVAEIFGGGGGADTLTGNGGSDVFVFGAGDGNDRITDFSTDAVDGDVVRLVGSGYATRQAVIDSATDTVDGVLIAFGSSETLLLEGVLKANLSIDDFVLG